jgi:hypothetical protein
MYIFFAADRCKIRYKKNNKKERKEKREKHVTSTRIKISVDSTYRLYQFIKHSMVIEQQKP